MYRCKNCGKLRHDGDDVYYIDKPYFRYQLPCCSEECAKEVKEAEMNRLKIELERYINSPIEKDVW